MSYLRPKITSTDGSVTVTYGSDNVNLTDAGSSMSNIPDSNQVQNIGISYSSSTFTVVSADGTSFSGSNVGYITLPSASTPGEMVAVPVTADQSFIDDSGSSTIVGNLFGFGASETMSGTNVPFYLYAIMNDADDELAFAISRTPSIRESPSSSFLGKTGSATADTNLGMFLLSDPILTEYDNNPCKMIGSFRMQLTSAGDWTVTTLTNRDGIGSFQVGQPFTLNTGVFGAASGSFFKTNGGTAPAWSSQVYGYTIQPFDATMTIYFQASGSSTDGVGTGAAHLALPLGHANMTGVSGRKTGSNRAGVIGDIVIEEGINGDDIDFIQAATYSTNETLAGFSSSDPVRVNVTFPIYNGLN